MNESRWLRRLVCLFVLYKCIYWWMDFDLLFSSDSIVLKSDYDPGGVKQLAYLLLLSDSEKLNILFLLLASLCSVYLLIIKKYSRPISFVLWFVVLNINNKTYPGLNGGDYLLQQLLFFAIFLSAFPDQLRFPEWDKAFHNFGVAAIKVQLCMVYFIAGLTKVLDAEWLTGSALADILKIHEFSLPLLYHVNNSFFLAASSYFVIAYQLCFPLLIWLGRVKPVLITLGIIQHLFIALVLGLPSFGIIMIISYSIFYFPFSYKRQTKIND